MITPTPAARGRSSLHLALGAIVAAGGFSVENDLAEQDNDGDHRNVDTALLLFEPQVAGFINLTRFARLGVHAGYRLTAFSREIRASDLRGVTAGMRAELGWF